MCCLPRLPPIRRETLTDLDNLLDHEIPKRVHHEVARYIILRSTCGKKVKDNPGGRIQAVNLTRIIGIIWLVEAAVAAGYNTAMVE